MNLRPVLLTDQRGDPSPHGQQLPSKRTGVSASLLQETDVTGLGPLPSKQQTVVVTPVGASVLPALECGVTCALIAESRLWHRRAPMDYQHRHGQRHTAKQVDIQVHTGQNNCTGTHVDVQVRLTTHWSKLRY